MKLTKIGDFLKRSKIPIDIQDDIEYKRVTIRINHNGVSLRDSEVGKLIGTKKQFILKAGQFIVSKIDARYGAFGIAPNEVDYAIITGNFWAYDVDKELINIDWFNQFTNSPVFYDVCERASSGITHRKYLDEKFFLNYEILLPSVEEQLIQIENINLQKESFGAISTELTHQLDLVKKLRQQLLQDAVQGKLVPQNPNDEPASELLKKIKAEKETLVAEKKTKLDFKLHQKSKLNPPFELPENWEWVRFWEIAWCYRGHNPAKIHFKKEPENGYVRFIQITDFKTDDQAVYVPISKQLKFVAKGEIVMAAYRHIGKFSREMEGAFNVALCKINNIEPFNRDYLSILIQSDLITGELLAASERGHIPSMHTEHLLSLWVPVPPLSEQKRIIQKLDELMQYCTALEAGIKQSQQQNEKLLQQVLREALRKEPVGV